MLSSKRVGGKEYLRPSMEEVCFEIFNLLRVDYAAA